MLSILPSRVSWASRAKGYSSYPDLNEGNSLAGDLLGGCNNGSDPVADEAHVLVEDPLRVLDQILAVLGVITVALLLAGVAVVGASTTPGSSIALE